MRRTIYNGLTIEPMEVKAEIKKAINMIDSALKHVQQSIIYYNHSHLLSIIG